jgi:hypothetical protein
MKEFMKKLKGNGSFGVNDAIQWALATCLSRWRKPAQRFKNSQNFQNFQNPRFSRFRPGFSSILHWILVFVVVLILVLSRFYLRYLVSYHCRLVSIAVVSFLPHIITVLVSIVVVSRFHGTTATASLVLHRLSLHRLHYTTSIRMGSRRSSILRGDLLS